MRRGAIVGEELSFAKRKSLTLFAHLLSWMGLYTFSSCSIRHVSRFVEFRRASRCFCVSALTSGARFDVAKFDFEARGRGADGRVILVVPYGGGGRYFTHSVERYPSRAPRGPPPRYAPVHRLHTPPTPARPTLPRLTCVSLRTRDRGPISDAFLKIGVHRLSKRAPQLPHSGRRPHCSAHCQTASL